MKPMLNKARIMEFLRHEKLPRVLVKELISLEDIPDFDNAEDEMRFWRSHTISQELLDQIPEIPEEEE